MAKLKRVLRAAVKNGEFPLSKETSFLRTAAYVALSMHEVKGKFAWLVEIEALAFKKLLATRRIYRQIELEKENAQSFFEEENIRLRKENQALLKVNKQLLENIEADKTPDKFQRSPKNYHNAAETRGFKATTNLALQGGHAGLEKK